MLHGCVEVGPSVVHRICAEVQRWHFDPPDLDSRMPRVRVAATASKSSTLSEKAFCSQRSEMRPIDSVSPRNYL
jgi:hypothetical protein